VSVSKPLGVKSGVTHVTAVATALADVTGLYGQYDGLDRGLLDEISDPQKRLRGYIIYDNSGTQIGFAEKPPFHLPPDSATTSPR